MASRKKSTYSSILYAHTKSEAPDPASFERHCHEYYELLYVVSGRGRYVVEKTEYPLQSNTLLLIRPYEFHYVCPQKDTAYERYVINFRESALSEVVAALSILKVDGNCGQGVYFSAADLDESVREIFDDLDRMRALFENVPHHRSKQNAMMQAELTKILLLLSVAVPKETMTDEETVITRVIEYLNLRLDREISLDELAQHFFVSKYYLCHAFRKHTGVSVFNYLNAKRIAKAQHLLEMGEPATSVAYQVGFRNYSSFYRTFCKLTGHAPMYRRNDTQK